MWGNPLAVSWLSGSGNRNLGCMLDIGKIRILIKHFIHVIWGIAVCKKIHAFRVRKHILYSEGIDKVVALQKF